MEYLLVLCSCFSLLPTSSSQFLKLVSPPELPFGIINNISEKLPLENINPIETVTQLLQIPSPDIPFENYNPRELFDKIPGYGKSWMYFPNEKGNPVKAQLNYTDHAQRTYLPEKQYATFHLYTRLNPNVSQILELNNITSIKNTNFNYKKPTKFLIHGWTSSYKSDITQTVKNNFLLMNDYNVIIVDWSEIASNIIYPIAAMETRNVGDYVGKMVDFLVENGAKLKEIHLIGHSLGAHTAGRAGSAVKSGKVERITGLDPALPGFEIVAANDGKLDKSDAKFIDVIHTCGGVLGYYTKLGHVDFYPNGGTPSQPGCIGLPQIIEACSHGRAWEYFAESIKVSDGFIATQCDSWYAFKLGLCANNEKVAMGIAVPETTEGVFYLRTPDKPPYIHTAVYTVINATTNGLNAITGLAKTLPGFG